MLALLGSAQTVETLAGAVDGQQALDEQSGHDQRREHGEDDTYKQRDRKSDNGRGTDYPQHHRADKGGDVAVQYRRKRTLETGLDGGRDGLGTVTVLVAYALEDDVVPPAPAR